MEFKSEYYTSWEDYVHENEIDTENEDVIKANTQSYEEMVFDFTMWLVM
ncbi:MAG: hypothetical protein GX248_10440 [Peptococcaceae bacterium]|jgi:hypothetical protein|nr:hypothetical protein [Peptococcaceae bacterium]